MNETQWLPGLFALAVAFAIAGIYLLFGRRGTGASPGAAPSPAADRAQEELERRAQTLLEALRELKESRHQHAPEQYQAEVSRLEREAAAALRARDEGRARPAAAPAGSPPAAGGAARAPAAAGTGFFDRHPQLKGAVWGGGVVTFFVALGLVLSQEATDRGDGEMTGLTPPSGAPAAGPAGVMGQQEDPRFAAAMRQMQEHPEDLEAVSEVTHTLIQRRQLSDAQKYTERGLAIDPFHVELRVHASVLKAARGDMKTGRAELQRLVDLYPGAEEALLFLGSMAIAEGDRAGGLEQFERFALEVPREKHPAELFAAIAELRQQVRGGDVPPQPGK